MLAALAALAPSVGVCALFVFAMRKMIAADRHERAAEARMDAEEARRAAGQSTQPGQPAQSAHAAQTEPAAPAEPAGGAPGAGADVPRD